MRFTTGEVVGITHAKAAEKAGVTEQQLVKILKAGKIKETDQGLIDSDSVAQWIREREEINARVYIARRDATLSYEMNGRNARNRADEVAREHFKKELKELSDAAWDAWNKKAKKDLEAEYAKIEANRLSELRVHGVPETPAGNGKESAK